MYWLKPRRTFDTRIIFDKLIVPKKTRTFQTNQNHADSMNTTKPEKCSTKAGVGKKNGSLPNPTTAGCLESALPFRIFATKTALYQVIG